MNQPSESSHPISVAIRRWEDQNRLERAAFSQRNWVALEDCQAEKAAIMDHLDRLLSGRRWDSFFSNEVSRKAIRQRIQSLLNETQSSLRTLSSLRGSMDTEWEETRRSLTQVHRVRGAYNPFSSDPTWVQHS